MIRYGCLNEQEKRAYELFLETFESRGTVIDARSIRDVDPMKVLNAVLGDHPRFVYFNKTQISTVSGVMGPKEYRLTGVLSGEKLRRQEQALEQAVQRAMEEVELANPMNDFDRLTVIYEYIQDHVVYDQAELERVCRGSHRNPDAHSAYGALCQGKAVCDGIADAFCLLAQRLGYECTCVSGKSAFRTQGKSSHAWNVIRVKDKFYHVDTTWDVNQKEASGDYCYEYFCVDDDAIATDHVWEMGIVPFCTGREMSWYHRSRCFANNLSQAEDIFRRVSKSKQCIVRVRISDAIPIPEPAGQYLAERLRACSSAVGRYSGFRYGWNKDSRCFYGRFHE